MTNESDEIRKLSQKIIQSLESCETDGLEKYKSILLENEEKSTTFDEYLNQLQKKLKKCTCQASWDSDVLIIRCLDCQTDENSCICVNCFLKGKHDGHKILINHGNYGCCDCGDPFGWSKSGFCCDHSGPESNPEQTQLDQSTRIKLISISNSSLHYIRQFANTNLNYFHNIIEFLIQLVSLGDATRRCVSISMCEYFDVIELYTNSTKFDTYEYRLLNRLISSISSDDVFRAHFSTTIYNNLPKIIKTTYNISSQYTNPRKQPILSMANLIDITFFAVSATAIDQLIIESKIDFSEILNESLHLILINDDDKMKRSFLQNISQSIFRRLIYLWKSAIKVFGGKNIKVIETIEKLSELLSKSEFSLPIVRVFGGKADDINATQESVFYVCHDVRHFISKVTKHNIFTTKPLFELKKFFDSPRYKSIDELVNDYQIYFHSVLSKNVNFCQTFNLHLLSFLCLNLKEEKKLIDYISEVTDNVELFIKRWAVLPLRWMAASILSGFNFFVRNTDDTYVAFASFKFKKNIKYSFVPTFSLIQSLLKATKDVDTFLLMIISTFDLSVINDHDNCNFDKNEKQLILFCTFHFISCLIFDTFCSSRNFYMMHRLTIISELMIKNMSLEEINYIWFNEIYYDDKLLDDLKNITSKETTKKGTVFHLTDDSEWHPLISHLELPKIIELTQKFITKNPDSLINFPSIPEGNENLLFSPTLWALEYCILDSNSCKDYRIIQQLIFNILIVTANNSESFYKGKENQNLEVDNSVLHVDDFENLIDELKSLTFDQFMRKKIDFNMNNEDDGKSMIDLISCLGNIGLTVLKRMNISDIDTNSSEENLLLKQQMQKKNKERANKFKSEMMNSFIQKQKTFQSSVLNDNQDIDEKVPKIECGICHIENESDCFVYPATVFKSSLSSYIKWRFQNAKLIKLADTEMNSIDFTNIPETFESFNSVHICLHPIHSHCIKGQRYSCPADRCHRNSALPIVDGICDFNPISNESLRNEVSKFISNTYNDDVNFAVFSLASEIEVLEMRHRSNPNCLDNKTVAAILRNIYLCIWQVLHSNAQKALINEEFLRRRKEITKKVEDKTWDDYKNGLLKLDFSGIKDDLSIESKVDKICQILQFEVEYQTIENKTIHLSPLMKYILYSMDLDNQNSSQSLNMKKFINGKLLPSKIQQNDSKINSDDNDSIFNDFDVINELSSDYQKLQFLRCAAIFDHFARNKNISQSKTTNKIDELIDWDEILCLSFLQKHYEINNNNEDEDDELMLPTFSFVNVPNNFLDFIRPPFSFPVDLNNDENKTAFCLLTGQAVSLSYANDKIVKIEKFINQKFCGSFSIFVSLNGNLSSNVFIIATTPYHEVSLKSFYTNKFDEIDLGLEKGFLLFLNKSKRDEIIDNFLSGSWSDLFTS